MPAKADPVGQRDFAETVDGTGKTAPSVAVLSRCLPFRSRLRLPWRDLGQGTLPCANLLRALSIVGPMRRTVADGSCITATQICEMLRKLAAHCLERGDVVSTLQRTVTYRRISFSTVPGVRSATWRQRWASNWDTFRRTAKRQSDRASVDAGRGQLGIMPTAASEDRIHTNIDDVAPVYRDRVKALLSRQRIFATAAKRLKTPAQFHSVQG